MSSSFLRGFSFDSKFRMSFNHRLIFTGHFIDSNSGNILGKNLYVPETGKHPAITLKISGTSLFGEKVMDSIMIDFNSDEERDLIAAYDFTGDTFYVEK